MDLSGQRLAGFLVTGISDLDSYDQLLHFSLASNLDLEFVDRSVLPDDILNCAGKHVYAPDDQHSIGPSQHSSPDESGHPAAFTPIVNKLDEVSCSIPDQRTADSPEVRHDKLAALRRINQGGGLADMRINHLRN